MKIAHVRKLSNGSWDKPQTLRDHIINVARLASKFARSFNSSKYAFSIGILHDTGKSTSEWQSYLRAKSGYEIENNTTQQVAIVEHSIHGAKLAEEIFGKAAGRILSYVIAGHHAGLPDWYPDASGRRGSLSFRLSQAQIQNIDPVIRRIARENHPGSPPWKFNRDSLDLSLWIRMLFSCLVDADFLDTEEYMNFNRAKMRKGYKSLPELLRRLNGYIEQLTKNLSCPLSKVNRLRSLVLQDCRQKAYRPVGIYSLTVPTGGGKTLSSLDFGLRHAIHNKLDRVIYVIPYTSIIEQNADIFRKAVGEDQIIEHHSNVIVEDEKRSFREKEQIASENWDAPLIVTTTVQFFESLFSSRTSRCRKLHNIARSVVILDEAQLLPVDFLEAIIRTMEILSDKYSVSFVLCTATQPALEKRIGFNSFNGFPRGSVHEIINNVPKLYRGLQRVKYTSPQSYIRPQNWNQIALSIMRHPSVLCVVSDRKSCRDLYCMMPVGTYHLSALMCGQHRSDVILEIKRRLLNQENIRVISTQVVEAGVDIDFPVVYRALAGLDSIAQAAGRCNREGKRTTGQVVVFIPPKRPPFGILGKAAKITESLLKRGLADPSNCKSFERFFADLYWRANSLDREKILDLLKPEEPECAIQFRTASTKFRIIDDAQKGILIPYGKGKDLIKELKSKGPSRMLLRKLQRYIVNVYEKDFEVLKAAGSITEISDGIFALISMKDYDLSTGLKVY